MSDTNKNSYFSTHTGKEIDEGVAASQQAILRNEPGQETTSNFQLTIKGAMLFKNNDTEGYSGPATIDDFNLEKDRQSNENSIVITKEKKKTSNGDYIPIIAITSVINDGTPENDCEIRMEVCCRSKGKYHWRLPQINFNGETNETDGRLGYITIAGKVLKNIGPISSELKTEVERRFMYPSLPEWMGDGYINPYFPYTSRLEIERDFFLPLCKPMLGEHTGEKIEEGVYLYRLPNFSEVGLMTVNDDNKPLLFRFSIYDSKKKKIIARTKEILAIGKPRNNLIQKNSQGVEEEISWFKDGHFNALYVSIR